MKTIEEQIEIKAREYGIAEGYDGKIEPGSQMGFEEGAKWMHEKLTRWRNPGEDPPVNQDIVLVKTNTGCYSTAYWHGPRAKFITYGDDAYDVFGEITGWRPVGE